MIHLATLAQSSAQSGQPPAQIVPGGGTVDITLTVLEISGSGSRLVNAGIPLQEAQLTNVNNAALWLNTGGGLVEVSCYVASLAPHLDGSVRSLLVQWTGDPDDITAAELRLGAAVGVARDDPTTCPAQPVATLMPSSAHLIACDLFPYIVTPTASVHADYSDYDEMFTGPFYYGITNDMPSGNHDRAKYGRAATCFYWLVHKGPGVANATDYYDVGCEVASEMYTNDPGGQDPEYSEIDFTGNALHYMLTGYLGSRTRIGQYASAWGGAAPFYWGGGRHNGFTAEAVMYAYLLDIDDVSNGGNGPYTKAEHIANLATLVAAWDAAWEDGGDAALPVQIDGIHNTAGNGEGVYVNGPDSCLPYMNGIMHEGVVNAFRRLAGESSTLDALKTAWETDMLYGVAWLLDADNADIYDDTAGVNIFGYAMYIYNGATGLKWTDGDEYEGLWCSRFTAEAGTTTSIIHDTGSFANAEAGDVIYNQTRGEWDTIETVTSDDEVELTGTITGQTTGDDILLHEFDYADKSFPGTFAWPFWASGWMNIWLWNGADVATGAQQITLQNAARTAFLALIARMADPGTDSTWGAINFGIGPGSYTSPTDIDQLGVNAIVGAMAKMSPWLDEGVLS